jgi:predicted nucleic-acid-binding protein
MLGIDTNVVVRLVVADDADQTARARGLIEQTLSREEPVLVSLLVLLECEWVLRSRYGFSRAALMSIFRALLEARELSFEDEPALEEALFHWKDSACGFSDCSLPRTIARWDVGRRRPSTQKQPGSPLLLRSDHQPRRLPAKVYQRSAGCRLEIELAGIGQRWRKMERAMGIENTAGAH